MVVAALLVAAGLLFAGDEGPESEAAGRTALPEPKRIDRIEREVERLRGLEFRKRIRPQIVTPAQARKAALRDVDKDYPPKKRRADEELLKLLALVPPDTDVVELLESVSGEQVVGYYDTRRKQLRLVSGNGADSPALVDITLAHEMVHALEDQVFDLDEPEGVTDDGASARTALSEGTATYVMNRFAQCCVSARDLALGSLGSAFGAGASELPPYVQRTLLFSYQGGEEFVRQLYQAADGWKLVDAAIRSRPPVSTEQIIHPDKYVPFEPPLEVKLRVEPLLGDGWERAARGSLGELDTRELLRLGDVGRAAPAAAGWGGGRYELWQRTGAAPESCPAPCRSRDVLVLAWRWDTEDDAREFEPVLRRYAERALRGRSAGERAWGLDGGAVAVSTGPRETALAFAPTAAEARKLADRAPVSGR